METAPIQPGMEQQAAYKSWARIKAALAWDASWGGAQGGFFRPLRADFDRVRQGAGRFGKDAGSGGQRKLAAPSRSNTPTLLGALPPFLLKAASINTGGKQPKVTAAGESGLPDEIEEKPWSVYGSNAWPVSCHRRWQPLPWRAAEKPIAVQPCRCRMNAQQDVIRRSVAKAIDACPGRWLECEGRKVQFQILTFLGKTWCGGDRPQLPDEKIVAYTRKLAEKGGVVTFDVPIQKSGLISQPFVEQLREIGQSFR